MDLLDDIDVKSVVFGAAIAAGCIILGSMYNEWLYPFGSIGFLYVGYQAKNLKMGTILGAFASTPIIYLALDGKLGFIQDSAVPLLVVLILFVGGFVGFVGAWAKRDRIKAKEEYEKKQKIGKNKNKKKNKDVEAKEPEQKKGFLSKLKK